MLLRRRAGACSSLQLTPARPQHTAISFLDGRFSSVLESGGGHPYGRAVMAPRQHQAGQMARLLPSPPLPSRRSLQRRAHKPPGNAAPAALPALSTLSPLSSLLLCSSSSSSSSARTLPSLCVHQQRRHVAISQRRRPVSHYAPHVSAANHAHHRTHAAQAAQRAVSNALRRRTRQPPLRHRIAPHVMSVHLVQRKCGGDAGLSCGSVGR